jgi:hypothetical protein
VKRGGEESLALNTVEDCLSASLNTGNIQTTEFVLKGLFYDHPFFKSYKIDVDDIFMLNKRFSKTHVLFELIYFVTYLL